MLQQVETEQHTYSSNAYDAGAAVNEVTFDEQQEDKENQSLNVLPQSLQMIKADQQAKDAKALIGIIKRTSGKSPTSGSRGKDTQKRI